MIDTNKLKSLILEKNVEELKKALSQYDEENGKIEENNSHIKLSEEEYEILLNLALEYRSFECAKLLFLHFTTNGINHSSPEHLLTKLSSLKNILIKFNQPQHKGLNLINARTKDGSTALHLAAKTGFYQAINELISHGADPYLTDANGLNALNLAINHHQNNAVHQLITSIPVLMFAKVPDELPIFYALKKGNLEAVKILAVTQPKFLEVKNTENQTPIEMLTHDVNLINGLPQKKRNECLTFLKELQAHSQSNNAEVNHSQNHTQKEMPILHQALIEEGGSNRNKHSSQPILKKYQLQNPKIKNYQDLMIELIKTGADPAEMGVHNQNAIQVAAINGLTKSIIVMLKDRKELINAGYGVTPLNIACAYLHIDTVEALMEMGADPKKNFENSSLHTTIIGTTRQISAVEEKNLPEIQKRIANLLLREYPDLLELENADGTKAIQLAVIKKNTPVFRLLVSKNAKVDCLTTSGDSLLHLAIENPNQEIFETLLARVDATIINKQNEQGDTPLHVALRNAALSRDHSAADLHRRKMQFNFAKTLILKGARIDLANRCGYLPLHMLIKQDVDENLVDNGNQVDVFQKLLMLKLLIEANEKLIQSNGPSIVNAKTEKGDTALHLAAEMNFHQVISLLYEAGADPLEVNSENENALDVAIYFESAEFIEKLIIAHPELMLIEDSLGNYPIHTLAKMKHYKLVKFLAHENSETLAHKNDAGQTPYDIIKSHIDSDNSENGTIAECLNALFDSSKRLSKQKLFHHQDKNQLSAEEQATVQLEQKSNSKKSPKRNKKKKPKAKKTKPTSQNTLGDSNGSSITNATTNAASASAHVIPVASGNANTQIAPMRSTLSQEQLDQVTKAGFVPQQQETLACPTLSSEVCKLISLFWNNEIYLVGSKSLNCILLSEKVPAADTDLLVNLSPSEVEFILNAAKIPYRKNVSKEGIINFTTFDNIDISCLYQNATDKLDNIYQAQYRAWENRDFTRNFHVEVLRTDDLKPRLQRALSANPPKPLKLRQRDMYAFNTAQGWDDFFHKRLRFIRGGEYIVKMNPIARIRARRKNGEAGFFLIEEHSRLIHTNEWRKAFAKEKPSRIFVHLVEELKTLKTNRIRREYGDSKDLFLLTDETTIFNFTLPQLKKTAAPQSEKIFDKSNFEDKTEFLKACSDAITNKSHQYLLYVLRSGFKWCKELNETLLGDHTLFDLALKERDKACLALLILCGITGTKKSLVEKAEAALVEAEAEAELSPNMQTQSIKTTSNQNSNSAELTQSPQLQQFSLFSNPNFLISQQSQLLTTQRHSIIVTNQQHPSSNSNSNGGGTTSFRPPTKEEVEQNLRRLQSRQ